MSLPHNDAILDRVLTRIVSAGNQKAQAGKNSTWGAGSIPPRDIGSARSISGVDKRRAGSASKMHPTYRYTYPAFGSSSARDSSLAGTNAVVPQLVFSRGLLKGPGSGPVALPFPNSNAGSAAAPLPAASAAPTAPKTSAVILRPQQQQQPLSHRHSSPTGHAGSASARSSSRESAGGAGPLSRVSSSGCPIGGSARELPGDRTAIIGRSNNRDRRDTSRSEGCEPLPPMLSTSRGSVASAADAGPGGLSDPSPGTTSTGELEAGVCMDQFVNPAAAAAAGTAPVQVVVEDAGGVPRAVGQRSANTITRTAALRALKQQRTATPDIIAELRGAVEGKAELETAGGLLPPAGSGRMSRDGGMAGPFAAPAAQQSLETAPSRVSAPGHTATPPRGPPCNPPLAVAAPCASTGGLEGSANADADVAHMQSGPAQALPHDAPVHRGNRSGEGHPAAWNRPLPDGEGPLQPHLLRSVSSDTRPEDGLQWLLKDPGRRHEHGDRAAHQHQRRRPSRTAPSADSPEAVQVYNSGDITLENDTAVGGDGAKRHREGGGNSAGSAQSPSSASGTSQPGALAGGAPPTFRGSAGGWGANARSPSPRRGRSSSAGWAADGGAEGVLVQRPTQRGSRKSWVRPASPSPGRRAKARTSLERVPGGAAGGADVQVLPLPQRLPSEESSWQTGMSAAAQSRIRRLEEQVIALSAQVSVLQTSHADLEFQLEEEQQQHARKAVSAGRGAGPAAAEAAGTGMVPCPVAAKVEQERQQSEEKHRQVTKQLQEQIHQLQEQVRQLQKQCQDRETELNDQLTKARMVNDTLAKQNRALYSTLEETLSAAEHAAQELKQLRGTHARLQASHEATQKEATVLKENVDLRERALSAVQAEFNTLRRRHDEMLTAAEAARREAALRDGRLRREVDVATHEAAQLAAQLTKLQREHQQLHCRKAEKDRQLAALTKRTEVQQEQLAAAERLAQEHAALVRELESRATLLRNRNAALDRAVATEKEARQAAQEQVRQMEEEIALLVAIIRQSDPTLETLARYKADPAAAAAMAAAAAAAAAAALLDASPSPRRRARAAVEPVREGTEEAPGSGRVQEDPGAAKQEATRHSVVTIMPGGAGGTAAGEGRAATASRGLTVPVPPRTAPPPLPSYLLGGPPLTVRAPPPSTAGPITAPDSAAPPNGPEPLDPNTGEITPKAEPAAAAAAGAAPYGGNNPNRRHGSSWEGSPLALVYPAKHYMTGGVYLEPPGRIRSAHSPGHNVSPLTAAGRSRSAGRAPSPSMWGAAAGSAAAAAGRRAMTPPSGGGGRGGFVQRSGDYGPPGYGASARHAGSVGAGSYLNTARERAKLAASRALSAGGRPLAGDGHIQASARPIASPDGKGAMRQSTAASRAQGTGGADWESVGGGGGNNNGVHTAASADGGGMSTPPKRVNHSVACGGDGGRGGSCMTGGGGGASSRSPVVSPRSKTGNHYPMAEGERVLWAQPRRGGRSASAGSGRRRARGSECGRAGSQGVGSYAALSARRALETSALTGAGCGGSSCSGSAGLGWVGTPRKARTQPERRARTPEPRTAAAWAKWAEETTAGPSATPAILLKRATTPDGRTSARTVGNRRVGPPPPPPMRESIGVHPRSPGATSLEQALVSLLNESSYASGPEAHHLGAQSLGGTLMEASKHAGSELEHPAIAGLRASAAGSGPTLVADGGGGGSNGGDERESHWEQGQAAGGDGAVKAPVALSSLRHSEPLSGRSFGGSSEADPGADSIGCVKGGISSRGVGANGSSGGGGLMDAIDAARDRRNPDILRVSYAFESPLNGSGHSPSAVKRSAPAIAAAGTTSTTQPLGVALPLSASTARGSSATAAAAAAAVVNSATTADSSLSGGLSEGASVDDSLGAALRCLQQRQAQLLQQLAAPPPPPPVLTGTGTGTTAATVVNADCHGSVGGRPRSASGGPFPAASPGARDQNGPMQKPSDSSPAASSFSFPRPQGLRHASPFAETAPPPGVGPHRSASATVDGDAAVQPVRAQRGYSDSGCSGGSGGSGGGSGAIPRWRRLSVALDEASKSGGQQCTMAAAITIDGTVHAAGGPMGYRSEPGVGSPTASTTSPHATLLMSVLGASAPTSSGGGGGVGGPIPPHGSPLRSPHRPSVAAAAAAAAAAGAGVGGPISALLDQLENCGDTWRTSVSDALPGFAAPAAAAATSSPATSVTAACPGNAGGRTAAVGESSPQPPQAEPTAQTMSHFSVEAVLKATCSPQADTLQRQQQQHQQQGCTHLRMPHPPPTAARRIFAEHVPDERPPQPPQELSAACGLEAPSSSSRQSSARLQQRSPAPPPALHPQHQGYLDETEDFEHIEDGYPTGEHLELLDDASDSFFAAGDNEMVSEGQEVGPQDSSVEQTVEGEEWLTEDVDDLGSSSGGARIWPESGAPPPTPGRDDEEEEGKGEEEGNQVPGQGSQGGLQPPTAEQSSFTYPAAAEVHDSRRVALYDNVAYDSDLSQDAVSTPSGTVSDAHGRSPAGIVPPSSSSAAAAAGTGPVGISQSWSPSAASPPPPPLDPVCVPTSLEGADGRDSLDILPSESLAQELASPSSPSWEPLRTPSGSDYSSPGGGAGMSMDDADGSPGAGGGVQPHVGHYPQHRQHRHQRHQQPQSVIARNTAHDGQGVDYDHDGDDDYHHHHNNGAGEGYRHGSELMGVGWRRGQSEQGPFAKLAPGDESVTDSGSLSAGAVMAVVKVAGMWGRDGGVGDSWVEPTEPSKRQRLSSEDVSMGLVSAKDVLGMDGGRPVVSLATICGAGPEQQPASAAPLGSATKSDGGDLATTMGAGHVAATLLPSFTAPGAPPQGVSGGGFGGSLRTAMAGTPSTLLAPRRLSNSLLDGPLGGHRTSESTLLDRPQHRQSMLGSRGGLVTIPGSAGSNSSDWLHARRPASPSVKPLSLAEVLRRPPSSSR